MQFAPLLHYKYKSRWLLHYIFIAKVDSIIDISMSDI